MRIWLPFVDFTRIVDDTEEFIEMHTPEQLKEIEIIYV